MMHISKFEHVEGSPIEEQVEEWAETFFFNLMTILNGEEGLHFTYAALVMKDGKYGFIDDKGNYILPPKFDDARGFSIEGYAPVKGNGKWGFLDHTGAIVVPLQFDAVGELSLIHI